MAPVFVKTRSKLLPFFLTLCGVLFFAHTALAQPDSARAIRVFSQISGTVAHATTGHAVEGATVAIKNKPSGIATDSLGRFSIYAGQGDTLVISATGFLTYEIIVAPDADYSVELSPTDALLESITVVGSRGRPRTDVSRPVPVDVISAKELENTGQIDLGQMVQFTSPSFNSAKTGVNGIANFTDPASLRGMSPDQSLLLVNGKRRHLFSAVNNNITPGKGTVAPDLNSIPAMAVERLEILRDGAAAQYGSDAIAGIMNLSLKKNIQSGSFKTQWGITHKGDGAAGMAALNYGFGLGKKDS